MIFEMASCGGCRTCEMACSFKHTGEFVPTISSIKIVDKDNELGFVVTLAETNNGQRLACDGCTDLDVPWCVQYCEKAEDLTEILRQFLKKRKHEGKQDRGR